MTRSTSPARTSRSELSACRPAPGFTTSRGRERSAEPSPAVPDRPPRQDSETCPERHRQLPTRQLRAAPSGPHAGPSPSSTTSPYDKVPAWLPTRRRRSRSRPRHCTAGAPTAEASACEARQPGWAPPPRRRETIAAPVNRAAAARSPSSPGTAVRRPARCRVLFGAVVGRRSAL